MNKKPIFYFNVIWITAFVGFILFNTIRTMQASTIKVSDFVIVIAVLFGFSIWKKRQAGNQDSQVSIQKPGIVKRTAFWLIGYYPSKKKTKDQAPPEGEKK